MFSESELNQLFTEPLPLKKRRSSTLTEERSCKSKKRFDEYESEIRQLLGTRGLVGIAIKFGFDHRTLRRHLGE